MKPAIFEDRREAGKLLADLLIKYKDTPTVVYALPRGGVVVADEICHVLHLNLDLIITRKVSHPENPEYAIASVSENGKIIFHPNESAPINNAWFDLEVERGQKEAVRRREVYLNGKRRINAKGKNAIIVDDGVATGLSTLLAIEELREDVPWKIIVAVPVVPEEVKYRIRAISDEFVACESPSNYKGSVSSYYNNFSEISDDDVIDILKKYK